MTDLTRLPGTAALDDVTSVIDRDGGVIVEDFVPPTLIAELKADLLGWVEIDGEMADPIRLLG